MRSCSHDQSGVTMVELIVALAILGVIAGVTALSFGGARPIRSAPLWATTTALARAEAIDSARPVTIAVRIGDAVREATAMPDGSVIADSDLHIDRLTGASRYDAER